MEVVKKRTARGIGRWGHQEYGVELVTTTQSWTGQAGVRTAAIDSFELVCSLPVGSRYFSSDAERTAFLAKSFSDLRLDSIDPPEIWTEDQPLAAVLGQPLSVVELVRDRLELAWGDDTLSVSSRVALVDATGRMDENSDEFADRVLALRGRRLMQVDEILDRGLVLTFEGPIDLEISLSDGAVGAIDAAAFSNPGDWNRGASWPVGEAPFA